MRDDIHRHAPIGPKLRALLRRTLREADRVHAVHIRESAAAALFAEFSRELSTPASQRLKEEIQSPRLFSDLSGLPNSSPLQDVKDYLSAHPGDVRGALAYSLGRFVDANVMNARSGMIERGGASPAAIRVGVEFFRSALSASITQVVKRFEGQAAPKPAKIQISKNFILPLAR